MPTFFIQHIEHVANSHAYCTFCAQLLTSSARRYWPGQITPRSKSAEIISTMDVLPTALSLAGVNHDEACAARHLVGRMSFVRNGSNTVRDEVTQCVMK